MTLFTVVKWLPPVPLIMVNSMLILHTDLVTYALQPVVCQNKINLFDNFVKNKTHRYVK